MPSRPVPYHTLHAMRNRRYILNAISVFLYQTPAKHILSRHPLGQRKWWPEMTRIRNMTGAIVTGIGDAAYDTRFVWWAILQSMTGNHLGTGQKKIFRIGSSPRPPPIPCPTAASVSVKCPLLRAPQATALLQTNMYRSFFLFLPSPSFGKARAGGRIWQSFL